MVANRNCNRDEKLRLREVVIPLFGVIKCPFNNPTKLCNEVVTIDTIEDHLKNCHTVTKSYLKDNH